MPPLLERFIALSFLLLSPACEIVVGSYAVGASDGGTFPIDSEEDASFPSEDAGWEPAQCSGRECPVELASAGDSTDAFVAIAVDGGSVYWTDGSTIWSCAVAGCGGTPSVVVDRSTVASGDILAIAVDGTRVFWASGTAANRLFQCPVAGCTAAARIPLTSGGHPSGGLVVDSTSVYWTDADGVESCPVTGCSSPTLLASGRPWGLLTADAANLYWAELDGTVNSILACAKTGCDLSPAVVMQTELSSYPLAATLSGVYWLTNGPPGVSTCPRDELDVGCGVHPTVLDTGFTGEFANDIASDGASIYWTTTSATSVVDVWSGRVVTCAATGACSTLATVSDGAPTFIAADATGVYWTEVGSGPPRVMRRPR